jgi:hypothetical protein
MSKHPSPRQRAKEKNFSHYTQFRYSLFSQALTIAK